MLLCSRVKINHSNGSKTFQHLKIVCLIHSVDILSLPIYGFLNSYEKLWISNTFQALSNFVSIGNLATTKSARLSPTTRSYIMPYRNFRIKWRLAIQNTNYTIISTHCFPIFSVSTFERRMREAPLGLILEKIPKSTLSLLLDSSDSGTSLSIFPYQDITTMFMGSSKRIVIESYSISNMIEHIIIRNNWIFIIGDNSRFSTKWVREGGD